MKGDRIVAFLRRLNRYMGQLPQWPANRQELAQQNAPLATLPNVLPKQLAVEKPTDMEYQERALFQLLHHGNAR